MDNGYARPIEGVVTVIDLNRKEVVRVEDYGVVPLPPKPGNWVRATSVPHPRADLKPLDVSQAEGPSFTVNGHEVRWQKWAFRVGFNPREGLVLNTVAYDGRPILYRGSIAEMIVPYADPQGIVLPQERLRPGRVRRRHDGQLAGAGMRLPGNDPLLRRPPGRQPGAGRHDQERVCLHEEDFGMLWKHTDWRTNQSEVRRSRRLAVSMIATVGNYDYGFYWYFYQDGTIQMEVKLTGIMNTMALKPGESPRYGTEVAPRLMAPNHQHFFNARLDLDIDGEENTAQEVNTLSVPAGPENPHGNAFFAEVTPLLTEAAAQRNTNPLSARFWRVVNESRKNELGSPSAIASARARTSCRTPSPTPRCSSRAGFLTRNLWVTPYQADERYPTGEYPNQNPGGDGLPRWTQSRPQHRRDRPGRLVHVRPDAHPPRRGLARDAGQLGRLPASARRLLQRQPRTRSSSSARHDRS